ncbi:MAG: AAA family ATPase, partial [Gammaproteobacteria bacterium]|nr:AAA family ATPase [Gammaproteobacteria bacterium]
MNSPPVWPFTTNESGFSPRLVESMIRDALSNTPVVCVLGARQSGKTALVKHMFPDRPYVDLDTFSEFVMASENPGSYIERLPDTVTIDEVQNVPNLIDPIRVSVDQNRRPGRFILTASINLHLIQDLSQALAGRMEIIDLHPLTESERSRSSGKFLIDLLNDWLK